MAEFRKLTVIPMPKEVEDRETDLFSSAMPRAHEGRAVALFPRLHRCSSTKELARVVRQSTTAYDTLLLDISRAENRTRRLF